jgi:hypothetical protein
MAKQSLEERFERGERRPRSIIAAYFTRYTSPRDALHAWRSDTPKRTKLSPARQIRRLSELGKQLREDVSAEDAWGLELEAEHLRRWQQEPLKKRTLGRIIAAFETEPGGFRRASEVLFDCVLELRSAARIEDEEAGNWEALRHPDPRVRVAYELETGVWPLLLAFENPLVFFRDFAPQLHPDDFPAMPVPGDVHNVLETWGIAALLNPIILEGFLMQCRNPIRANVALAAPPAIARQRYDPKGGRRKKPWDAAVDDAELRLYRRAREIEKSQRLGERGGVAAALKEEAELSGLRPNSVRKRHERNRRRVAQK